MLYFSRAKIFAIIGAIVLGLLFALPNAVPADSRQSWPDALQRTINLGLDLQGGAHLLLEVDLESVLEQQLQNEIGAIRGALRENGRIATQYLRVDDDRGIIEGRFRDAAQTEAGLEVIRDLAQPVAAGQLGVSADTIRVTDEGNGEFTVAITEENIEAIRARTIEQSIEVLRRRIDPTGTTEMTLAREGDDRILLQVPGAKNIDEIKERINTSANLSFHLVRGESDDPNAVQRAVESATDDEGNVDAGEARVRPGALLVMPDDPTETGPLIVEKRTRITGECLQSSKEGLNPNGGGDAVVNFTFNTRCARYFGEMTVNNTGRQFAVVLDDKTISAPVIRSPILGGQGFIEGGFTMESAQELSLLLNAGALPAKLDVVEERSVSATLGQDSINAGRIASLIGLAGVGLFMWFSYGLRFGTIANIALGTNIVLIAGALSLLGSTLTLPGIAGIILTIGMAVDANVLIFERIREEAANGRPPVNAIETGYRLSLAPILDANITTLIAAVTLYFVGSGPVRGFAVTLAIGIVMSVFTAVIFARLLTATWLRRNRPKSLPI